MINKQHVPPGLFLNTSLKKYLFLNFITGGLYFYIVQTRLNWIFSMMQLPKESRAMKNSVIAMWSSLGMFIIITSAMIAFPDDIRFALAGLGFFVLFVVMQIIWSYQCRTAIKAYCHKYDVQNVAPNAFFILFIPGVLIVRSINHLTIASSSISRH